MPKVSEMIVSKFLKKEDFEEDRVLTIKGVKLEDMPGNEGQQKWVLYFREEPKGLAMSVTTIRVLEQAFGSDSDHWIGNRVKVYVDPSVSFGGKVVGGLRIRTPKAGPKAPVAPPPPPPPPQSLAPAGEAEFDDDIPF